MKKLFKRGLFQEWTLTCRSFHHDYSIKYCKTKKYYKFYINLVLTSKVSSLIILKIFNKLAEIHYCTRQNNKGIKFGSYW